MWAYFALRGRFLRHLPGLHAITATCRAPRASEPHPHTYRCQRVPPGAMADGLRCGEPAPRARGKIPWPPFFFVFLVPLSMSRVNLAWVLTMPGAEPSAAGVERELQELQRWAREFSPSSEGARSACASGSSRACPSDVFAWDDDEVGEATLQLRTSKRPACAVRGRSPWLSPGREMLTGGRGEPGTRRYSAARAASAKSHFDLAHRAECAPQRFRSLTPPLALARSRTPSMTPPLRHDGADSRTTGSRTVSLTPRLTPVSPIPRLTPPLHHYEDAGMEVPRAGYEAQACASAGRGTAGSRDDGVDGDGTTPQHVALLATRRAPGEMHTSSSARQNFWESQCPSKFVLQIHCVLTV